MTAAELQPGDVFRLVNRRRRYRAHGHRSDPSGIVWCDATVIDQAGNRRAIRGDTPVVVIHPAKVTA